MAGQVSAFIELTFKKASGPLYLVTQALLEVLRVSSNHIPSILMIFRLGLILRSHISVRRPIHFGSWHIFQCVGKPCTAAEGTTEWVQPILHR